MSEREALLAAILDDPADDTRRLAFADWLQETGKAKDAARAEFIRLQVYRHQLHGEDLSAPIAIDGLKREIALLNRWVGSWLPKPMRPGYPGLRVDRINNGAVWVDPLSGFVRFERGFVERVGVDLPWRADDFAGAIAAFGRHVQTIFATNPLSSVTASFHSYGRGAYSVQFRPEGLGGRWGLQWDAGTDGSVLIVGTFFQARTELARHIPHKLDEALRSHLEALWERMGTNGAVEGDPHENPAYPLTQEDNDYEQMFLNDWQEDEDDV